MKASLLAVSMAMVVALAGCGPIYQTDYEIVPAESDIGRMCGNNCLASQQNCVQSCQMQTRNCEAMARLAAENDYLVYVNERRRSHKPVKRHRSSFSGYGSYGSCGDSYCVDRCESDYRICHTNCGGQVIPHTYCTAFCD